MFEKMLDELFQTLSPQKNENIIREFLTHLFLECLVRYGNVTSWNDTLSETTVRSEILSSSAQPYLRGDNLEELNIDIQNADLSEEERYGFYATISSYTMEPKISRSPGDQLDGQDALFCPVRFDGYLCWPKTPAGTILSQYCPDFVEGFDRKFLAHKTCMPDGSWYRHPESGNEWSNYTNCVDYDDLEFRHFVNGLYVKGYTTSLIALLLSIAIFLGFKSLRCTRIRIHVHLFVSLAFTCLSWILWYKLVIGETGVIRANPAWCVGMHLINHYFMLVNYFWMFCEGLHLHLVLVVVFVKDVMVMRLFKFCSWGLPLLLVLLYAIGRFFQNDDNDNCWINDSWLLWLFSIPILLSLMASFFFLINVLRVIIRKLHPQSAQPAPLAIRKAVRATIILVPLFGLQHFLLPYRPDVGSPLERFYQFLSVILVSLQGLVVSILFCFANHDVAFAVRSLLNRMMPSLISPPPPGSNTGQMGTTTPSRELGV